LIDTTMRCQKPNNKRKRSRIRRFRSGDCKSPAESSLAHITSLALVKALLFSLEKDQITELRHTNSERRNKDPSQDVTMEEPPSQHLAANDRSIDRAAFLLVVLVLVDHPDTPLPSPRERLLTRTHSQQSATRIAGLKNLVSSRRKTQPRRGIVTTCMFRRKGIRWVQWWGISVCVCVCASNAKHMKPEPARP